MTPRESGNALIVNTHGLMKIRCKRPTSNRLSMRFSSGQRSALRQLADPARHAGVPHQGHAAAVTVQRLERLEAEEAGIAERPDRPAVERRAQCVRAVFDHLQVVAAATAMMRPCRTTGRRGASARRRGSPA